MLMRIHLTALFSAVAVSAAAQEPAFRTPALLIGKSGESREILLLEATGNSFRYRTKESAADPVDGRIPEDGSIFVFEPREFSAAMDLYQARKYAEAKEKFIAVKERFKPIRSLENSPAVLAAFYELECLRKLGDLEGLARTLRNFDREPLGREIQLRQLELHFLWDAVRTKSWDRLEALAREWENVRLPGEQRAQVAWCHGLALEGLNRPTEALSAYQTVLTADAGASEEITRQAALRILSIHKADPEVQQAIMLWATKDEDRNSKGRINLTEAAAVAELFELSLGAGTPLPAGFREFLKYKANPEG